MARPLTHLIASAGIGALLGIRSGRLVPAVTPLVSGFLIDGDHLIDLLRYRLTGNRSRGQVVLPLHGWEYVPLLYGIERLTGGWFGGALLGGYLGHLLIDQFTNTITHPLTYFLSFRWSKGFATGLFNHLDESHIHWMQTPISHLWKYF